MICNAFLAVRWKPNDAVAMYSYRNIAHNLSSALHIKSA
jgi:hypothetical protein